MEILCYTERNSQKYPLGLEAWIKKIVMELGKLNGAVNFAGVVNKTMGKPEGGIEVLDQDEWDFCIGINLTGVMQCLRADTAVCR